MVPYLTRPLRSLAYLIHAPALHLAHWVHAATGLRLADVTAERRPRYYKDCDALLCDWSLSVIACLPTRHPNRSTYRRAWSREDLVKQRRKVDHEEVEREG
jgi:hypothetical protein